MMINFIFIVTWSFYSFIGLKDLFELYTDYYTNEIDFKEFYYYLFYSIVPSLWLGLFLIL